MTDDISLSLAVGLVVGILAFAALRRCRGSLTWNAPVDLDAARAAVAETPVPPLPVVPRVLPESLHVKTWRDPKTGLTKPLRRVWRNRESGAVKIAAPIMEHVHPAMAETHAAAATLIADLWRQPSTIPDEEDGS
jgi:hypothetical protein